MMLISTHAIITWLVLSSSSVVADFDYQVALSKSIIFLEAQRSGKLPINHRLSWRGDSALQDGQLDNADLVGGYYDAGDNIKFGLPMAFTVTTLSWAAIVFQSELQAAGELENVLASIRWGTDYFFKASSRRNLLYVQVGDPDKDHECWIRPENMQTPRTVFKIDKNTPGTEIAAETAAAMTAASIVFRHADHTYSRRLLKRGKSLFQFAKDYKGTYDGECPYYCSFSGYNDELLWAATWLYAATRRSIYMDYIRDEAISSPVSEFSWDLKYAGAQVLLSRVRTRSYFFLLLSSQFNSILFINDQQFYMEGNNGLHGFKQQADSFVCSILPQSPNHQVQLTPGGLVHLRDGANSQYATGIALLFSVYSEILGKHKQQVECGNQKFDSTQLLAFAKQQMDYLLGKNPQARSYMVGFGKSPPTQAHHRGASVPKLATNKIVDCPMSFVYWYDKNEPNPNELTGAIVGGPDKNDNFEDRRSNSSMTEPTTYTNSMAIGVLAKLAKYHAQY